MSEDSSRPVAQRVEFRVERTSDSGPEQRMAFESLDGLLEWIKTLNEQVILTYAPEWHEDVPWNIEIYDGYRE